MHADPQLDAALLDVPADAAGEASSDAVPNAMGHALCGAARRGRASLSHPLQRCGWLDFPVKHDARGNLSFIENRRHVPFDMERVYFLYDIPCMAERAGHAHRNLVQAFIAMSGSFDLHLDDGTEKRTVHLCRSHRGYLVQPWTWRTLDNFSGGSVCLVLASLKYDEEDYIRSYPAFRRLAAQRAASAPGALVQ